MPQNLKTDSPTDTPELPELEAQEFEFVQQIVFQGAKIVQAYREAYNPTDPTAKWVQVEASRVRARPNVALWISTLRKQRVQQGNYDLDDHIAELDAAIEMCRESGNMGAMVSAMKAKGQAKGFYVALHEDVGKRNRSAAEMIEEIDSKLGKEFGDLLAKKLGVERLRKSA